MRKIGFIAAASLLVLPAISQAKPLNELLAEKGGVLGAKEASPAKVSYNNGVVMDFGDATVKTNVGLQTLYSYYDWDGTAEDSSSFDVRNTRLELEGTLMNGEFKWVVSNDFGSSNTDSWNTGSELQDAFLMWNWCDTDALVMGQWKTPYGREAGTHYANLQFIDRSGVSDAFTLGRQAGVGYAGQLGEMGSHTIGVFNGESVVDGFSEGQNLPGRDNKVLAVYGIGLNLIGDYDRSYEGDVTTSSDLSLGIGAGGYYGQVEVVSGDFKTDADEFGASVDAGLRVGGFSAQTEFFYAGGKWDEDVAGEDAFDNFGMYASAGYFVVPGTWEVAGRFGWISYDDSASAAFYDGIEDQYEVNAVLSYYINGHNLKFMTGPSWVMTKFADDSADDLTDFRYQAGFFGYF